MNNLSIRLYLYVRVYIYISQSFRLILVQCIDPMFTVNFWWMNLQ